MNKKQILGNMSEEQFYKLYPTKEAYMKAKGGTPEAFPQQPTQSEFFDFGRIPSGPQGFYQGGGYMISPPDPQERIDWYKQSGWKNANIDMINRGYVTPADTINQKWFQHPTNPSNVVGINFPSPITYKDSVKKPVYPKRTDYSKGSRGPAFSMKQLGGDSDCPECEEQFGGMVDNDMDYFKSGGSNWIQKATKGMRTDKPCTGSKFGGPSCPPGSRRYNLAKTFRAMAKKQFGGDTAEMFVDDEDYGKGITSTFLNAIKNNVGNSLADEAAEQVDMAYAQMGMSMQDYGYNPNMMYNQMYSAKADYLKNQGQQAMNNFYGATMNLEETKNPYMDYTVVPKAQKGAFTNAPTNQVNTNQSYSDASGKTHWSDDDFMAEYARRNGVPTPNNQANYNPGYGQGHPAFPMNYNPGYKWRTQGLEIPVPYNPNNTYLTHLDAKKRFFGPGARRIQMDFRTYGQPGSQGNKSYFDQPGWSPTEDRKPKTRGRADMSYAEEVEDLRQQALLRGQGAPTTAPIKNPHYPFAPKDTSGVPYLNPQRAPEPDRYPFAPQMEDGGNYQDWSVVGKYRQGYDPEAAANWMLAGTAGLTSMVNAADRRKTEEQMMKNTLADNVFSAQPADMIQNKGRWNWTGMSNGMMDPGNMQVIQQPGYAQMGAEVEMTENEIEEFLRNGGQIQYL